MSGQVGYKSRVYRAGTQIHNARKIDAILLAVAKVDATDLESANFTKEYVRGFSDPPEIAVDYKFTNTVEQQQIMIDAYAGTQTTETWKIEIRDPITDALQVTMTFSAYIASAGLGPLEAEALVLLSTKLQIAGAITIAF